MLQNVTKLSVLTSKTLKSFKGDGEDGEALLNQFVMFLFKSCIVLYSPCRTEVRLCF